MNDGVSILVAVFLILIALRWMLGGNQPSNPQSGQRRSAGRRQHRVTPQMIEMVRSMFPDIPTPAIVADLQRTGSVETTVENALRAGGLPMPANYSNGPATDNGANSGSSTAVKPVTHTNLLQRYDLDSHSINGDQQITEPPKVWEASPDKRQEMLRKRKEFMVLQARKKLEQRMLLEKQQGEGEKEQSVTENGSSLPSEKKAADNFEEMSVDELNTLSAEQRRRHMLQAFDRRTNISEEGQ
ncbi:hypothetical protein EC973_000740 [Apophysomyces ossiformis]|uniref:CUE domain-containing protein n=1 Tax=Apophysomyces ossiformis TaxID=679940 RepID=A0A8H7BUQ2_9FUNG|nr:hypothetical protein EC973_000740 [Apophysomyces ossiformis]